MIVVVSDDNCALTCFFFKACRLTSEPDAQPDPRCARQRGFGIQSFNLVKKLMMIGVAPDLRVFGQAVQTRLPVVITVLPHGVEFRQAKLNT